MGMVTREEAIKVAEKFLKNQVIELKKSNKVYKDYNEQFKGLHVLCKVYKGIAIKQKKRIKRLIRKKLVRNFNIRKFNRKARFINQLYCEPRMQYPLSTKMKDDNKKEVVVNG